MCVMITCYRVLSLKFIEIHFAFDMVSFKNKIGYPAMKITFLLSDLNLSRIKVISHLRGCPSKLYAGEKLNNCSLRWKYNLSGFFCQEVSGAGKVWNDWGLFFLFIGYRMPQHEQNGYIVLFTRHPSTTMCQAFSIFWLVVQISASKLE